MKKFGKGVRTVSMAELFKLVDQGIEYTNKLKMEYNKKYGFPNDNLVEIPKDRAYTYNATIPNYPEKINLRRYGKLNKSIFKPNKANIMIPKDIDVNQITNQIEAQNNEDQSSIALLNNEIQLAETIIPEPLVTASTLPQLRREKIFTHDTVQVLESLKTLEFKEENKLKFIDMLGIIRKKKDLKIYDFPEITNILNYLRNDLESIPPSYKVSLLYSLSKIQSFNEKKPSLENKNLIYEILNSVSRNIKNLDVRTSANLVYSLQTFQMKSAKVYNFGEFFDNIEVDIIDKLLKNIKTVDAQSLSNIVLSYCKVQSGSEEFYRILQEIIYSKSDLLGYQDIAIIIYSYANNSTCNEKILELFEDKIKADIYKFRSKELCSILRAYHMRKLLAPELKTLIKKASIEKYEVSNALDLSYFYTILAEKDNEDKVSEKFKKYIENSIDTLMFTFSGQELGILSQKIELIQSGNVELYKKYQKQVLKLISRNEIKGYELKQIYLNIKPLAFEGKYNTFRESIERHLEKLKYY
jgi:hypothetical protein